MSPALTLPKRVSIFSLGVGIGSGSSSLKRMSTRKVSKSTDALMSLDSPSVSVDVAPSTPVALTRARGGGIRSSFLNLFRPTLGGSQQRRPSFPVVDECPSGRPLLPLTGDRPPSDCSSDLSRSAAAAGTDDDDEDEEEVEPGSVAGSSSAAAENFGARSAGDRLETNVPPALPRRPQHHLLDPSWTPPKYRSNTPPPLLPRASARQSPAFYVPAVRMAFTRSVVLLALSPSSSSSSSSSYNICSAPIT